MLTWPADIPTPRFKGFQGQRGRRATRFEPDEGPAKQRTVTTAALHRVVLVFKCNVAQRDKIMDFFDGPGAGGGVWFSFVQPFKKVPVNARFIVGSEPSEVEAAPFFNVTVTLEVDAW